MKYKIDASEIRSFVESLKELYGFDGLMHFTDFKNLKMIFDRGYLYSRSYCKNNNISFTDGANHDVLDIASNDIHQCVRFYYRGSTPTLYNNEGIKLQYYCNQVHIPIPVYLIFDEELLYLENTMFSNGNATTSEIGKSADFFINMDWDSIFHYGAFAPHRRDHIINKRQAELLCCDPVSLKYLRKIVFRCETDRKRAINIFGYNIKYEVDINVFSHKNTSPYTPEYYRNNFIKNYAIRVSYDNIYISAIDMCLLYQKPWHEYDLSVSIFNQNNDMIRNVIIDENSINETRKELRLTGNTLDWHKIEVGINDFICIEEYLIKFEIIEHKITFIDDKVLVLHLKFAHGRYFRYNHSIEIFSIDNQMVHTTSIKFSKSSSLSWRILLRKYNNNWFKINYYMNGVLSFSDKIVK